MACGPFSPTVARSRKPVASAPRTTVVKVLCSCPDHLGAGGIYRSGRCNARTAQPGRGATRLEVLVM